MKDHNSLLAFHHYNHHLAYGLNIPFALHFVIHFHLTLSNTYYSAVVSGMSMSCLIMSLHHSGGLPNHLWLEKLCWHFLDKWPISCQMTCPNQDIQCFLMHSILMVSTWSSFLTTLFVTLSLLKSPMIHLRHPLSKKCSLLFLFEAWSFTSIHCNRQYEGLIPFYHQVFPYFPQPDILFQSAKGLCSQWNMVFNICMDIWDITSKIFECLHMFL